MRASRAIWPPILAAMLDLEKLVSSLKLTRDRLIKVLNPTRERLLSGGYILAVAAGALLLSALLHLPHGPEHWSADLRTALLSKRPTSQHEKIVLVYVTDETLKRYYYTAPTDRGLLAELVRTIDAATPAVIALDFILDRPTEPSKDDDLVRAVRDADAKVVIGAIGTVHREYGPQRFEDDFIALTKRPAGHLYFGAHHNALVVSDHVVRATYEHSDALGKPSFAVVVARAARATSEPDSHYISWLLPPSDGTATFLTLSAESVLGLDGSKLPLRQLLNGRIVMIGGNFFDRDRHLTPLSVLSGHRYPGLFIHAQIVAQILEGRSLTLPDWWPWQVLLIVLAAGLGFWSGSRSGSNHLFVELATVASLILIGILAFWLASIIFPYTGTLLAWLGGAAGGHYGQRHHA
jgi:adenylate cyclase